MSKKQKPIKRLTNPSPKGNVKKLTSPKLPRGHQRLCLPHCREEKPSISLKYIDLKFKSFDDLKKENNLKSFDNFLSRINDSPNWESIFTSFQRAPTNTKKANEKMKFLGFDPDQIEMFHLRVTQKFRVHGFRNEDRFKLIWLDPDHEINKE